LLHRSHIFGYVSEYGANEDFYAIANDEWKPRNLIVAKMCRKNKFPEVTPRELTTYVNLCLTTVKNYRYNLSTKRSAHSGNSSSSSPLFLSLQKKQVWAEFFKMQVGSKSVDDIDSSMMKRLQQRYKLKSAMSTGSRRLGRICNLFSSSTDDGSLRQFRVKKVWLVSFRT